MLNEDVCWLSALTEIDLIKKKIILAQIHACFQRQSYMPDEYGGIKNWLLHPNTEGTLWFQVVLFMGSVRIAAS